MSLNGIIGNALSGLQAAQLGMRTASNNVSNVNTPGYARTELGQAARNAAGQGMGVEVTGIRRVVDEFLVAASQRASSDASRAEAVNGFLDRLQAQFGSTDDTTSLFGRLNRAFTSIGSAALDPAESVSRLSAVSDLQAVFDEARRLSGEIRSMRDEADQRIAAGVGRVNEILAELAELNNEVRSLNAGASDSTGAQNRQAELLDELSGLLDVRAEKQPDGRVFVRTQNGVSLLDNALITLDYTPAGTGAYGVEYGAITASVSSSGATVDIGVNIRSGELRGLMDLRDSELPALGAQLAEFASGVADAVNAAHNDAAAYPPPGVLEGRNTGLLSSDVLTGSGEASIAVVASDGTLVDRIDLVFGAGGFTVNGVAGTTIGDLASLIDAASPDISASFADGRLTLTGSGTNGIATLQDETSPSSLGGRGFAHFFGLNDLVDSTRPAFFETAVTGTAAHGLAPGGEMSFAIYAPDGRKAQEITVPVTGTSLDDMIAALNDPVTGIGRFGSYALDSSGALNFTSASGYANYEVALTSDNTQRGTTGLAFSQVFGIGDAAAMNRAESFTIDPDIRSDTSRLALAKLDLTGASAAGDIVLAEGDGRGGQALQSVLTAKRSFSAAGGLAGGQASLEDYAARLAGDIGARAARAERSLSGAEAVKSAADQKRSDVEGVNLDEELARMTLYQQAYNASARLLQAAKEMTDALLSIV